MCVIQWGEVVVSNKEQTLGRGMCVPEMRGRGV